MVLAIIFFVLFLGCAGVGIYQCVSLVKTPMIEIDFRRFILKNVIFIAAAVVCFLVASFGFYVWRQFAPDALHGFELVVGAILLSGSFLVAVNSFIIHYYGKNIPEKLDKWLFRFIIIGFTSAVFFFFIYTNGISPCIHYPLYSGISFTEGLVRPGQNSNIAFYALCILSGAVLVYFICDHFMYKEYGEHGILESTFFVAFPAGIIGARIAYVIGNWSKEFADQEFWHVFAIWEGGITILGGAIAGIVVGVAWFLWRNKGKSIWIAFDLVLPTILIAQAVGRWGNFFNCEVHGLAVDSANWKWLPEIIFNNAQYTSSLYLSSYVGPDQLYVPLFFIEAIINLLGYFVLAHVFGKALRKYTELGDVGFGYIIWYGATRVLLEPLRSPDYQMGDKGYWSWVWSMLFVLAGTLLIVANHLVRYILRKKKGTYKVKDSNKKVGIISSASILVVGIIFLVVSIVLMSSNPFVAEVVYNGFNVGIMFLVLALSTFFCLVISLPILIEGFKNKPLQNE